MIYFLDNSSILKAVVLHSVSGQQPTSNFYPTQATAFQYHPDYYRLVSNAVASTANVDNETALHIQQNQLQIPLQLHDSLQNEHGLDQSDLSLNNHHHDSSHSSLDRSNHRKPSHNRSNKPKG